MADLQDLKTQPPSQVQEPQIEKQIIFVQEPQIPHRKPQDQIQQYQSQIETKQQEGRPDSQQIEEQIQKSLNQNQNQNQLQEPPTSLQTKNQNQPQQKLKRSQSQSQSQSPNVTPNGKSSKKEKQEKQEKQPLTIPEMMINAIEKNNDRKLLELVKDIQLNQFDLDKHGNKLLHYAASSGSFLIIELLISLGADPNIKNNNGDTPLHRALSQDNCYSKKSFSKILYLLRSNLLIPGGSNFNYLPPFHGCLYLQGGPKQEAFRAYLEIMISEYYNRGLDIGINLKAVNGDTPLMTAMRKENPWVIEMLTFAGAERPAHEFLDKLPSSKIDVKTVFSDAINYTEIHQFTKNNAIKLKAEMKEEGKRKKMKVTVDSLDSAESQTREGSESQEMSHQEFIEKEHENQNMEIVDEPLDENERKYDEVHEDEESINEGNSEEEEEDYENLEERHEEENGELKGDHHHQSIEG